MSIWALFWVAFISVVATLTMRNAYRLYRQPHEMRSDVVFMDAKHTRRAAASVLIGMPIIWLVVVLFMFGIIADPKF